MKTEQPFYVWPDSDPPIYVPRVTQITSLAPKPQLIEWMRREMARVVLSQVALNESLRDQLVWGDDNIESVLQANLENWLKLSDQDGLRAASIGLNVHAVCEHIARGGPGWDDMLEMDDDTVCRCVLAFKRWFDASVQDVLGIEDIVYGQFNTFGDPLRYGGRRDLRVVLKPGAIIEATGDKRRKETRTSTGGITATVDIKTSGQHYPEYGLQLAAYSHAADTPDDLLLTIRLDKENGQFYVKQWEPYKNREAFKVALALWYHFNGAGLAAQAKKHAEQQRVETPR